MKTAKKLEVIDEILTQLRDQNQTSPIIVEGEMDEASLRKLGVDGKIFRLHTGKSILNFCEDISRSHKEVIILTDWDKRGIKYFKLLKKLLTANEVKYIDQFWKKLKASCGKDIQTVEVLFKYIVNLEKD